MTALREVFVCAKREDEGSANLSSGYKHVLWLSS